MMTKVEKEPSVGREVGNFLFIIFSAVLMALLSVGFLVYNYGTFGTYTAKNVLLAPENVTILSYDDFDSWSNRRVHYIYDHLLYSYQEGRGAGWKSRELSIKEYTDFYRMIAADRSLPKVTEEVYQKFDAFGVAKLAIKVKVPQQFSDRATAGKTFQEVHFAPHSNYYRIQLHQSEGEGWAYFRHEAIFAKAAKLLK